MNKGDILEISYQRDITIKNVVLTKENCGEYEYTYEDVNGVTLYYLKGTNVENALDYDPVTKQTTLEVKEPKTYIHVAPPCSNFNISFADIDKEGSGRNSLTGEMFRDRVGHQFQVELTWDLIPNTKQYNNWYKILTHLPNNFNVKLLMPSGNIEEYKMYRGDVSTNLYLFVEDAQIWRGLSTTFIQWDVQPYNDSVEPYLEDY